jgi:putative ABC transport system permease protein
MVFRLTAIWEAFRVAIASLRANKLRTALTLVGIVVGVAAVIAVVTIIDGLNQTVAQTFSSQGSTVFTISKNPRIIKSREEFIKFNRRKDVTHEDSETIARLCTACWRVGIAANAVETVKYADQKAENVRIRGVDPTTMFDIDGVSISVGRIWTESEGASGRDICVTRS